MLIEATGEDKGGYASAETAFQVELGQLMSRMTHRETHYALAFPLTATFIKVLQKYRGTFAFTNLGICLLPVNRDGTCQIIPPTHITKFLVALTLYELIGAIDNEQMRQRGVREQADASALVGPVYPNPVDLLKGGPYLVARPVLWPGHPSHRTQHRAVAAKGLHLAVHSVKQPDVPSTVDLELTRALREEAIGGVQADLVSAGAVRD